MRVDASGGWMECSIYQNYTASEVLVQGLAGVVNQVVLLIMEIKNILLFLSGRCGRNGQSSEGNVAKI